jgi:hypothetical protein
MPRQDHRLCTVSVVWGCLIAARVFVLPGPLIGLALSAIANDPGRGISRNRGVNGRRHHSPASATASHVRGAITLPPSAFKTPLTVAEINHSGAVYGLGRDRGLIMAGMLNVLGSVAEFVRDGDKTEQGESNCT